MHSNDDRSSPKNATFRSERVLAFLPARVAGIVAPANEQNLDRLESVLR